jgi:hypothetical protein
MKRPFLNRFFSIIALIAITTSCSSDLDFNQKIGELSPYFEVKDIFIAEFFNNSTAQTLSGNPSNYPLPPQTIPFDINTKLTDKGIVSYLKKVVFRLTFTNTTNNECSITVVFQTDYFALNQYTKTVIVPPNTTNQDIVFLESDIPNLKSVTNLQFTGFMTLTGSTIPAGKLSVKSDATIYL